MEINKYTQRLYDEWRTHGKIIIGVDYDSTIRPWHTIDNEEDIKRAIKIIKDCQSVGCYLVMHTACNSDRYPEISEYCKSLDIIIDSINSNPIDLPYGKDGSKPYCNIFLDDRAGLLQALDILENAMILTRSYNYGQKQKNFDF